MPALSNTATSEVAAQETHARDARKTRPAWRLVQVFAAALELWTPPPIQIAWPSIFLLSDSLLTLLSGGVSFRACV
jgi:hypothetical protein